MTIFNLNDPTVNRRRRNIICTKSTMQMIEPEILENTLELIVPNKDRNGHSIDPQPIVRFLIDYAAKLFGGLKDTFVNGKWKNHFDKTISEKVRLIEICFKSEQLTEFSMILTTFVVLLTHVLNQETAAYKINGKLVLVPTYTKKADTNKSINGTGTALRRRVGRRGKAKHSHLQNGVQ